MLKAVNKRFQKICDMQDELDHPPIPLITREPSNLTSKNDITLIPKNARLKVQTCTGQKTFTFQNFVCS